MREKLEKWIDAHFDAMIEDLKTIVSYPSVSTYEEDTPFGTEATKCLNAFLDMAKSYGFDTENLENRCGTVTLQPGADKTDEICVWNHLDVVPVNPEDWTLTAPYEAKVVDGNLVGRGVGDNKGPAVAVLYLLRAFKELGVTPKHGFRLCVGIDEERGMRDVMFYARTQPAPILNLVSDSGFPVCYGEKGIIEVNIVTRSPMETLKVFSGGAATNIIAAKARAEVGGKSYATVGEARHSAHPHGAVNAIKVLTEQLLTDAPLSAGDRAYIEYFDRINSDVLGTEVGVNGTEPASGETTCAGTMCSLRPDGRAVLHLNIRYIITEKAENLLVKLDESAKKNGCTLETLLVSEPNNFPRENPIVDMLTGIYNEICDTTSEPFVMGGGTYARKLPNAVAFGMGLDDPESELFPAGHGGAHQADERLYLENYKKGMLIFGLSMLAADRVL